MSKKNMDYLIKKIKFIYILLFILLNISSILYNYNINYNSKINSRDNFCILTDGIPPEKIMGVKIRTLGNSINISWYASYESDLAYYKIYRDKAPCFPQTLEYYIANTTRNYFLDINTSMSMGTRYFYRISAVDDSGNEGLASDELGGDPYVPYYVNLDHQVNNQTSYIETIIIFPHFGFCVSDWGELNQNGTNFWVDSEMWGLEGYFPQAYFDVSHTYDLGYLDNGSYTFTFKSWGNSTKSIDFIIESSAILDDTAPNIRINMNDYF
jgi:hypothetical protein